MTEDMVIKQIGTEPKAKEIPNKHQPYLIMHFLTRSPMTCGICGGELRRMAHVGHQIYARHYKRSFTKVISCVPSNSPVRRVITFSVLHEATERVLVRPRGLQLMYSSQQKVRECWYLSFVTFNGGLRFHEENKRGWWFNRQRPHIRCSWDNCCHWKQQDENVRSEETWFCSFSALLDTPHTSTKGSTEIATL